MADKEIKNVPQEKSDTLPAVHKPITSKNGEENT